MAKYIKHIWFSLLWIAVVTYVIFASGLSRLERSRKFVTKINVNIVDSTQHGQLVSAADVKKWLQSAKLKSVGELIDSVDLASIENVIAKRGFVKKVCASVTYRGELNIDISQYQPLMRFVVNGYNSYLTADGYIFSSPPLFSLYVPVVTGSFKPHFPASYLGNVQEWYEGEIERLDGQIEKIELEKIPIFERREANFRDLDSVRKIFISQGMFERKSDFDVKVKKLRQKKADVRRKYRYQTRVIGQAIAMVDEKIEIERENQKKLEKNWGDLLKLITFVELVEGDSFWRSEIVQIEVAVTDIGELDVSLIPRSSRATILFGTLDNAESKLDKLTQFYEEGLSRLGWDRYQIINLKYKDLVVCKK